MESYSGDSSHDFVTVIPVEYPRSGKQISSHGASAGAVGYTLPSYSQSSHKENEQSIEMRSIPSSSSHGSYHPAPQPAENQASFSCSERVCVFLSNGLCICVDLEEGQNSTSFFVMKAIIENDKLHLSHSTMDVFALWLISPQLEIQLKAHHKPMKVFASWMKICQKYVTLESGEVLREPVLVFRRNVFYPKAEEMRIRDPAIIELLYYEARKNFLSGRYPRELGKSILLGSLNVRINCGAYNSQLHTTSYFRNRLAEFLPPYACYRDTPWSLIWPFSKLQRPDKSATPESYLLEQFKRLPTTNTATHRLMLHYLKLCWAMPYYGAAYFKGQIEERSTSRLAAWFSRGDLQVLIAVTRSGLCLIQPQEGTVLLILKYGEFFWECAYPSNPEDPDCFPCIFLQFGAVLGTRLPHATNLLQVFSKQAAMANALMTLFANQMRRSSAGPSADEVDGAQVDPEMDDVMAPLTNKGRNDVPDSCLLSKLNRLSLVTFDDEGRCVNSTGSLELLR